MSRLSASHWRITPLASTPVSKRSTLARTCNPEGGWIADSWGGYVGKRMIIRIAWGTGELKSEDDGLKYSI